MQLAPKYIEYLKAVVAGDMDDTDALQQWWDEHYRELRDTVPLWMLVRFLHGGKLCAKATLEELGELPFLHTVTTESTDWNSCNDPHRLLQHLSANRFSTALRRFAVGCCRRRVRWLTSSVWERGIQTAEAYANGHIPKTEWDAQRDTLTADFWDVVESDGGEITAAKEAVIATSDPSPFCAAVASSSAIIASVYAETDDDNALAEEEARQAELLRSEINRQREQSG